MLRRISIFLVLAAFVASPSMTTPAWAQSESPEESLLDEEESVEDEVPTVDDLEDEEEPTELPADDPEPEPAADPEPEPEPEPEPATEDEPSEAEPPPADERLPADDLKSDDPPPAKPRLPDLPAKAGPGNTFEVPAPTKAAPPAALPRQRKLKLPQAPEPVAPKTRTESDILRHLEQRSQHLRTGDSDQAGLELELAEEVRQSLGLKNVVVASELLIHESKDALKSGNNAAASLLADTATRFSPDLADAHWMRVRAYTAEDPTQIARIAGALVDYSGSYFGAFRNQIGLLVFVFALVALALIGTFLVFGGLQVFKLLRYPAHDLSKRAPGFVGTGEVLIGVLLVILMPLALGYGPLVALALALAIVMGYQTLSERIVSSVLIVAVACLPFVLATVAPLVSYDGSQVELMERAAIEAFSTDAELALERNARAAKDASSASILANRYRQRGQFKQAEEAYGLALAADSGDPVALNNLGVILFITGRREQAATNFTKAAGAGLPEALANQATLASELGNFEQAQALLQRLEASDAALAERVRGFDASIPAQEMLLDAAIDQQLLWQRLFADTEENPQAVSAASWATLGGRSSPMTFFIIMIVLLALGWGIASQQKRLSTGCPKCGVAASREARGHLCEQCQAIFVSLAVVDRELRERKERQVRRHQRRSRWTERILALAAGAGHVLSGRPVVGALLLFAFTFFLGLAFVPDEWFASAWTVFIDSSRSQLRFVLALVLAGVLSLISVKKAFDRW